MFYGFISYEGGDFLMASGRYNVRNSKMNPKTATNYNSGNPADPAIGLFKQSILVSTLTSCKGKIASCAKVLGVSMKTMEGYVRKSKALQECIAEFAELELDKAEEKLDEQIDKGNLSAIQFMLKCKGRERGWVEKTDVSVDFKKPITFKYTIAKPKKDAEPK
jgi:hypothetical protein